MVIIGWRVSADTADNLVSPQPRAGRWHYAGSVVVYCSSSPELAVLEARVHHRRGTSGYCLQQLVCPRQPTTAGVAPDALGPGWTRHPARTRALGDAWLQARGTACLRVPSSICPESSNLLINPVLAPGLALVHVRPFRFDRRLVRLLP